MKMFASVCSLLLAAGIVASAQEPKGERPPERAGSRPVMRGPMRDPMMEYLVHPELIRRFADELKLTDEQRAAIKQEMEKSREGFEDKEKKVRAEVEALGAILKADKVDEAAAAAQLDKVLEAEEVVKKARLMLMVRVKNLLTPEQNAKLAELRKEHMQRAPDRPRDERPRDERRRPDGPPPPKG
jgi:Spy/CpxP family protein refolding chaperone